MNELPVTARDIASATRRGPVLARVYDFTLHGWPSVVADPVLQSYCSRKQEFSVDQGCVLWGLRVVIPEVYHSHLLDDLHQEHYGIWRMKSLVRSYFWWPGLDSAIGERVSACHVCVAMGKSPPSAPLHPWKGPVKLWERIHIDFFEKDKLNLLIVVDTYSKWLEISMSSTTSLRTIEALCSVFARYGIPEELVSDDGLQLAAEEFTKFMTQNGVKFTRIPPYHPASNGAAERSVQMAKVAFTKRVLHGKANTLSLEHWLTNFLILNRNTPQLAAEEFTKFMRENGVKFNRVPSYNPASNGAAECSVQMAKVALTKRVLHGKASTFSLEHWLTNFLIQNCRTPHSVKGNRQLNSSWNGKSETFNTIKAKSEQNSRGKTGES